MSREPDSEPVTQARARLPYAYRPEAEALRDVRATLGTLDWSRVMTMAGPWVQAARDQAAPFWALNSLLREFPIDSAEGLALMRLAEALLRIPDANTAIALTADQLGRAHFDAAGDGRTHAHPLWAGLSASAIALSKQFLPGIDGATGLLSRLGARSVVAAAARAVQLLGRQFVLGHSIDQAMAEAATARKAAAADALSGAAPLRFSYDMLGEAARTEADAQRHLAAYQQAIDAIARATPGPHTPQTSDGVSIKLSALFARYEEVQSDRVRAELLPRAWTLVAAAAQANIGLTLDAEECERLELSLDIFEALASRAAGQFPQWDGLGLAVQAYQTRALAVIDAVAQLAQRLGQRYMVRLVKGAYWDAEIKRAQELGLAGYPVFTRKSYTDLSYLACAKALLDRAEWLYAQFATHNAGSIAAVVQMAQARGAAFEVQRLHGMSQAIFRELAHSTQTKAVAVRVYAPVGEQRDLLAYLVRRLLENGAHASFLHQLADPGLDARVLLASPLLRATDAAPALALPRWLYGERRANAIGVDLSCAAERAPLLQALGTTSVDTVTPAGALDIESAMANLSAGFPSWSQTPLATRVAVLRRAADALEARLPEFCALLVHEARKTLGDAVAEVREAIDFCRYYAVQAELHLAEQTLPGPTGELNRLRLHGRGVFVCISPWNFPLAIFTGQVVAALVTGNAVAAKPAEQTPAVAQRMVALLHGAGVPAHALALLHGLGETVGAALVADARVAGVCFTGSMAVARLINRSLAAKDGAIVPLIAETGGLNAMIVDSSALPEQVVDAVVQSAFRSAGQRCSALRLLCLHEGIADAVLTMLSGALAELRLGDPAQLSTDVGPLIEAQAQEAVLRHVARLEREARLIGRAPMPAPQLAAALPFVAPVAFEVKRIAELKEEVFGPVLHVVRWAGDVDSVVGEINALGYGLTLGIQTRIDSRALHLAQQARIGNVYVNRNMIGAVVGVQPFGGEGLSGSGPKAGGPHYLYRFCAEQTLTINSAAAGGNVDLLAPSAAAPSATTASGAPGAARQRLN